MFIYGYTFNRTLPEAMVTAIESDDLLDRMVEQYPETGKHITEMDWFYNENDPNPDKFNMVRIATEEPLGQRDKLALSGFVASQFAEFHAGVAAKGEWNVEEEQEEQGLTDDDLNFSLEADGLAL